MIPKITTALNGWESNINLSKIKESIVDYEKVEVETFFNFRGVVQPLKAQDLALKPLDTRSWVWYMIHTKTNLELDVGDIITYGGDRFKIMNKNNYNLNGYFEYHIVKNYE